MWVSPMLSPNFFLRVFALIGLSNMFFIYFLF
jgi:hypothetical protein